jgi:streptogramin lyase
VGVIDARSNKLVGEVRVGRDPESVAFGYGSVWVASVEDEIVSRVDPADLGATPVTISVTDDYPADIATGLGAVWVAGGGQAELRRILPGRDDASDPVSAIGPSVGCGSPYASLAVGAGSVWFLCEGGAFGRFDPKTSTAQNLGVECGLATFTRASQPRYTDMTFGLDALWMTDYAANRVLRVDPAVCQQPETITVGDGPKAVAVHGSTLWVANFDDGTVTRIENPGGAPVQSVTEVGEGPVDLAVDENAVWVANQLDHTVMRLDPETGRVQRTIDLGNAPHGIAVGDSRVWVTVRASSDQAAPTS